MAQPPSPLNPFLGSQSPSIPEKPAVSATVKAPAASSAVPRIVPASRPSEPSPAVSDVATPASKWWHRVVRRSLITLVLVVIIAGIVYWWFRDTGSAPIVDEPKSVTEVKEATPPALIPEQGTLALPDDNANFESENFKAGEIVIGGELQFLVDEDEVGALTVEDIRGEAFTEKNKQDVKLVVTWTTNKLAQASVRYSKGIGQTERGIDEEDYSYNHSVIISGLDPASTYLYTIDASDRYGNRVKSEPHAVFTGARTVSLFDLIAGAIGEVFGWAVTSR